LLLQFSIYQLLHWTKEQKNSLLLWPDYYFTNLSVDFPAEILNDIWQIVEKLLEDGVLLTEFQFLLMV
jgi:hypothetical protein